jgi:hypothetical protein
LQLLFEDPERLIDIVVANEYPQMFFDRAAAVFVRGRDVVSDPSRSTDLDVLGRLFTTITDNFIFNRLTLIERTTAGTKRLHSLRARRPMKLSGRSYAFGRELTFESCCRSFAESFQLWLWAASSTNARCKALRAAPRADHFPGADISDRDSLPRAPCGRRPAARTGA